MSFYPRLRPDELFRSAGLLRVALLRLLCERLLVEAFGRDDDWLFTVVLRLGWRVRCVEALLLLLRAGVARCVDVDVRVRWLVAGLLTWYTVGAADCFWRAGRVARFVPLPDVLPLLGVLPLRTEFVLGVVVRVVRVRVAGAAASRVRLLPSDRTASRLLFGRVVAPRVAVVFRLFDVRDVDALPFVVRLAVRAFDASATRAGRADERLLRSTSGR